MRTSVSGIVQLQSSRSVGEVLEHLLSILSTRGVKVFAVIDHSGEASAAGMEMRETKVVLFGNPKAGTPVMIAVPEIALDLPLRILIAEDPEGTTRISYYDPEYMQTRYGLAEELARNISAIVQIAATISS